MKAHIVTLRIIDFDGVGADGIKREIECAHYGNDCISPHVIHVESADIGEWDDDHPLNDTNTADAEWARLFPNPATE